MIKSAFLAVFLFLAFLTTQACEICGCSNNNFQIGILPTFNKGFVGFRYSASQFHSQVHGEPTEFSHDYNKTLELWGGVNFKKLQVMAFIPYLITRKESDDGVSNPKGAGDLMVLLNYKIFSSTALSKNEKSTFRHELYLGGGVKLPTGVNTVDVNNPDFNIGDFNSQAGTGSIDYLINVTHNFSWNRSGVVTNVAYRINTSNGQDYQFGNRTYLNSAYYYSLNVADFKFKPTAGINFQSNLINHYAGAAVEDSNGYNLNGTIGLNILYGNIGVQGMAFIPLSQDMYNGQTKLQSRGMVGVTYSF